MKDTDSTDLLLHITRHLMMNTCFMTDFGLYHGKMCNVLFFAHYARYTGDSLYDEFASELLDEILESADVSLPLPGDKLILQSIIGTLPKEGDIRSWKLGIENGCAGVGLKAIMR